MPNYRRVHLRGGTFFFTVVTYRRLPVFASATAVALLERCVESVMVDYPFSIDAMVTLPDHLHCIWSLRDGASDFSSGWKRVKTLFTRAYQGPRSDRMSTSMVGKGERGVWQRRFWEHAIRDERDFSLHCDYIHYNPVRHGLVKSPREWKHSTFDRFVRTGVYPPDWGSTVSTEVEAMELE